MDWQAIYTTLKYWGKVTALPALAVSTFAICLTLLNIWLSEAREAERLRRKHAAERATLPLVLSKLTEFSYEAFKGILPLFTRFGEGGFSRAELIYEPPEIPDGIANSIKSIIEATNSNAVRKRLSDIIITVQLIGSRLGSLKVNLRRQSYAITKDELERYIIDISSLMGLTNTLYKYARHTRRSPQPYNFTVLKSALSQLHFDEDDVESSIYGESYRSMCKEVTLREHYGHSPLIFDNSINYMSINNRASVLRFIKIRCRYIKIICATWWRKMARLNRK